MTDNIKSKMEQDPNKKRKLTEDESSSLESIEEKHLNWTSIQGHCLTGGGRAEELYTADRGYPFDDSELPHFHLLRGDTHTVFVQWKTTQPPASLVTGAWNRPLFCGGWHHTTDENERVYNVQTHNLFVDLRIPRTREQALGNNKSLDDLTAQQLRLYARQHVFAGFSVPSEEKGQSLCTRHHCIDWNFVGQGRPRPNKWWIHMKEDQSQWKESSYATDEGGQYYYFERWERRPDSSPEGPRLALRKSSSEQRDGIFVLVGDHFNYVLARELTGKEKKYDQASSLVALVDAAVEANDLETAKAYLSIEAGHGTVSASWKLDCAIPPWNEGAALPWDRSSPQVVGDSLSSVDPAKLLWGGESWDVMDCSFESAEELIAYIS